MLLREEHATRGDGGGGDWVRVVWGGSQFTLRSLRDHVGIVLASFWVVLVSFWPHFEAVLGQFSATMGPFGAILAHF